MKKITWALLLALFLLQPFQALSAEFTGIRGRAAINGQTVDGVRIFVFEKFDDLGDCSPTAVGGPTDLEGLYSVPVPQGKYWIVGYKGSENCPTPSPEDLFCFYGGNPVIVERGKPTHVGLSMIKIAPDPVKEGKKGITGYVYDEEGEPLVEAVVYFYKSPKDGFRGIPDYFTRTSKTGMFRARIGRGSYFILMRKRKDGEIFGPTDIGDYFGYYAKNPVIYDGSTPVMVRIDSVIRLSQLERFEGFTEVSHGIKVKGIILDGSGKAVRDYYVFAYKGKERTGMPDSISGKSDGEGIFEITLFEGGDYTLVARRRPGGPSLDDPQGEAEIKVEEGKSIKGVVIKVVDDK